MLAPEFSWCPLFRSDTRTAARARAFRRRRRIADRRSRRTWRRRRRRIADRRRTDRRHDRTRTTPAGAQPEQLLVVQLVGDRAPPAVVPTPTPAPAAATPVVGPPAAATDARGDPDLLHYHPLNAAVVDDDLLVYPVPTRVPRAAVVDRRMPDATREAADVAIPDRLLVHLRLCRLHRCRCGSHRLGWRGRGRWRGSRARHRGLSPGWGADREGRSDRNAMQEMLHSVYPLWQFRIGLRRKAHVTRGRPFRASGPKQRPVVSFPRTRNPWCYVPDPAGVE
jgi:hypothetical protein